MTHYPNNHVFQFSFLDFSILTFLLIFFLDSYDLNHPFEEVEKDIAMLLTLQTLIL